MFGFWVFYSATVGCVGVTVALKDTVVIANDVQFARNWVYSLIAFDGFGTIV